MDVSGEEEIAEILLHMRVADPHPHSNGGGRGSKIDDHMVDDDGDDDYMMTQAGPPRISARAAAVSAAATAHAAAAAHAASMGTSPGTAGSRRYGTRTAAGLKVGRRYTDLLND